MKHAPQTIWINAGEADELDTNDFRDLSEITWSENKVSSGDLKYVRERIVNKKEFERNQKDLNSLKEILDRIEMGGMNGQYAIEMLQHWRDELDTIVNFKKK